MAFGAGWFSSVPSLVWIIVHLVAALIGLYYLTKAKSAVLLMWAFLLFIVSSVLFTLVQLGTLDGLTVSALSTVMIAVAFVLVGQHSGKCCL